MLNTEIFSVSAILRHFFPGTPTAKPTVADTLSCFPAIGAREEVTELTLGIYQGEVFVAENASCHEFGGP